MPASHGAPAAAGLPAHGATAGGGASAPDVQPTAPGPASDVPGVPAPGGEPSASAIVGHAPAAPAPGVPAPGGGATASVSAEAPKPLHDPDPYSTPPYGEPGPWAPAPPVQHPATTPAHGMAVVAPPTAPEGPPHGPAAGQHRVPAQADAPATAPVTFETAPPAPDAPASGPWARYDPWAVAETAVPLQQADPAEWQAGRRRRRRRRTLLGIALLIALVSGVAGGVVGVQLERNGGVGTVELPQAGVESPDRDPNSVAGIAAQALPSVVTLHVSGGGSAGTGTGFVLDQRGHILTNDHVVGPAGDNGDITVTFNSGDTAEATVVGRDSGYDLAVVRVKGVRGLSPLPLGNSDNVQVGDPVVAIGAPFDLAGTVTSGIISARERPITAGGEKGDGSDVSYVDALQTDAPINPGNSGGPLLDTKGRVIGINSAIRSADSGLVPDGGQSGSIGLGFAIPINQGKRVAEELINTGKATHPVIGITLDMDYSGDGARVATEGSDGGPPVSTGGPGADAGIRPGDVITEVDGRPVHSGEELIVKTRAHRPGDRLELTLERGGEERKVSLVLGSSDGG
ncbi:trypsin-like peptidase domain-containing protein [Streptomyces tendae]|uniref:PDZ domain-containing protein n=1 Tax=Streptomyces tendae TaxID=1932 RepID=A0ABX5ZM50_STRTE|nr:trypsin-like peptidase domain-containing protein [Streptomyces tendae]QER85359.1 PDZ domain-containing protein [Streptomyces tendae]